MVEIRQMAINDYNNAYLLWESVPGMGLRKIDNSKSAIEKMILKNPKSCLVAVDKGRIVGTVLGVTDGRKGYLYHVAIAPDYQGQHISTWLLKIVKREFVNQGIKKIGIFVVNDNNNGKKYWQHQGFNQRKDIEYLDLDL